MPPGVYRPRNPRVTPLYRIVDAYFGEVRGSWEERFERLARYILRPPISLERMTWSGEGEVRYRRKAGHDFGSQLVHNEVTTVDPAEFLVRC